MNLFNPYQNFGKPVKCSKCGVSRNIEWVSISRENRPITDDWMALCLRHRIDFKKKINEYKTAISNIALELDKKRKEFQIIEYSANEKSQIATRAIDRETKAELNKLKLEEKILEMEKDFDKRKKDKENEIKEIDNRKQDVEKIVSQGKQELKELIKEIEGYSGDLKSIKIVKENAEKELTNIEKEIKEHKEMFKSVASELNYLLPAKKDAEDVIDKAIKVIEEKEKKIQELMKKEKYLGLFERRVKAYYEYLGKSMPNLSKYIE